ncbi:MAG: ChbG/HpnK family deacetylase [Rhodospirillales bacterium]|nr:ChbG/HpnK family deacetylase [Rhodospirillales bacterium]
MPDASRPKRVVLCADDYGIAPGVGVAIRDLIERGRLTSTSCMVVSPHWPAEAALLKPLAGRADIGLHLTLTDQSPAGEMPTIAPQGRLPPVSKLTIRAHTGRLRRAEIAAEIDRQLDRFEDAFGSLPGFVDGHHHVHQLPSVRDALLEVYGRRLKGHGVRVRYCDEPLSSVFRSGMGAGARAAMISVLGRHFGRIGRAAGIPGNVGFRGVRTFAERVPYADLFATYLAGIGDRALIMCHPGLADAALAAADSVGAQREEEYRYFLDERFSSALRANGVVLTLFRQLPADV